MIRRLLHSFRHTYRETGEFSLMYLEGWPIAMETLRCDCSAQKKECTRAAVEWYLGEEMRSLGI